MTNSFVSVPADLGQLNCAALVAGVIAGVLDGASFVSWVELAPNDTLPSKRRAYDDTSLKSVEYSRAQWSTVESSGTCCGRR